MYASSLANRCAAARETVRDAALEVERKAEARAVNNDSLGGIVDTSNSVEEGTRSKSLYQIAAVVHNFSRFPGKLQHTSAHRDQVT